QLMGLLPMDMSDAAYRPTITPPAMPEPDPGKAAVRRSTERKIGERLLADTAAQRGQTLERYTADLKKDIELHRELGLPHPLEQTQVGAGGGGGGDLDGNRPGERAGGEDAGGMTDESARTDGDTDGAAEATETV
ncbi:MAG: hypothetical protein AAGF47_03715, partial [Planctomycetota bacterium]